METKKLEWVLKGSIEVLSANELSQLQGGLDEPVKEPAPPQGGDGAKYVCCIVIKA